LDHGDRTSDNDNLVLLKPAIYAIEDLNIDKTEKDILLEIRRGNKSGSQEESVVRAAKELQHSLSRLVYSSDWLEREGLLLFQGKVYVLDLPDLHWQIFATCYDTIVARHPGR